MNRRSLNRIVSPHVASSCESLQLGKKQLCRNEIGGLKPLRESVVARGQDIAGLPCPPLTGPQSGGRGGGSKLPRDRALAPRAVHRSNQAAFGFHFIRNGHRREQMPLHSKHLGQIEGPAVSTPGRDGLVDCCESLGVPPDDPETFCQGGGEEGLHGLVMLRESLD
jgi:hypothetical protein